MNFISRAIITVAVAAGVLSALLLLSPAAFGASADATDREIQVLATTTNNATSACTLIRYPGYATDSQSGELAQASLSIQYQVQSTDRWCWAASAAMVIDYVDHLNVNDCQVLSAYAQANGQFIDCCGSPALCYRGGTSMVEEQTLLLQTAGVRTQWASRPLSECALRQELANGRPVIALLTSVPGVAAHVIVISGYDQAGFHIDDPYFGDFPSVPYRDVLSNATLGVWSDTLFLVNASRESVPQPAPAPQPPPASMVQPPAPMVVPTHGCSSAPSSMLGVMLAALAMLRLRRRR